MNPIAANLLNKHHANSSCIPLPRRGNISHYHAINTCDYIPAGNVRSLHRERLPHMEDGKHAMQTFTVLACGCTKVVYIGAFILPMQAPV